MNYSRSGQPLVVWIGSLCINQEDDAESGRQVDMMTGIYSQAKEVYTYLGEEADNSDKALKFLGGLNRNYPDHVPDNGARFRLEHANHFD
jgi:hypothetical protein